MQLYSVLIFFDLCFLRLNKDNSGAVKFKDANSAIWSSIMLFLKRKSQSRYMYVFFSLPSAHLGNICEGSSNMIDICMALDQSVSPHTGVRTIQNTGVFWQAVFQPPRPYSLFLEHGSAAKTLISHPHNTASDAGYCDIYCAVILRYSFALRSDILWSSCFESYGPKGEVIRCV